MAKKVEDAKARAALNDLLRLEKKHGAETLRLVANRLFAQRLEERKREKAIARMERELDEIRKGKRLPAANRRRRWGP